MLTGTATFMTPYLLLVAALNLLGPAAMLAVLLPVLGRVVAAFYASKTPFPQSWWAQAAINFIVGSVVLLAGIAVLGSDGKMLTYAALVLVTAACQWWQLGGWRG